MSVIDLHALIARLSAPLSHSLESAASHSVRNGNTTIELEHWLLSLTDGPVADLIAEAGVNPAEVRATTARAIEMLPRSTPTTPSIAPQITELAREAWIAASLRFGHAEISPEVLLLTLGSDTTLRSHLRRIAPALLKLNLCHLEDAAQSAPVPDAAPPPAPKRAAEGGFLATYAKDLTAEARAGRIDRIVGRDGELRQLVDILMRRRQNNPILLGEAGVGKTAVVEAFAMMIAEGRAPGPLADVTLYTLDLNLLQAGAGVKGEFERRLSGLVDEVRDATTPVILFIDEAHSLVGAGAQAGQGDAANILKPALARGELRTIAATTWGEYKKHIEKDPALTRRFQPVKVDEPDIETAIRMLRAVVGRFEAHHGLSIRESALRAAVELSARYLPERQLPDKAVSVIDTAAAAVRLSREVDPMVLQDLQVEADHLRAEIARLHAEPPVPGAGAEVARLSRALAQTEQSAEAVAARLTKQRRLADAADAAAASGADDALVRLATLEKDLHRSAGETPLVRRVVDTDAIAQVIGRWTGVPAGRLLRSQVAEVGTLADRIKTRVIGQDSAVDTLARAMRVARAGLHEARRPQGVFLMVGTSGIGKTEIALALADELYGGPQGLTVINMSEFKEEHKVSLLMGSPPGYVGYGEGGVLTEAVRRRPYGVLLLDEIDKAHPGVQDIFYQVFDKGMLRDGEGRDVDFRNTTILMTANTGTETLAALAEDPEAMPEPEHLPDLLKPELLAAFKPAFLGRLTVVPFLPLDASAMGRIVDLQLARIADRLQGSYGARMSVRPEARARIVERVRAGDTGARAIETMLARDLLPHIADLFLNSVAQGFVPRAIEIGVTPQADGFAVSALGKRRRMAS